jgi:hypothetical protein
VHRKAVFIENDSDISQRLISIKKLFEVASFLGVAGRVFGLGADAVMTERRWRWCSTLSSLSTGEFWPHMSFYSELSFRNRAFLQVDTMGSIKPAIQAGRSNGRRRRVLGCYSSVLPQRQSIYESNEQPYNATSSPLYSPLWLLGDEAGDTLRYWNT